MKWTHRRQLGLEWLTTHTTVVAAIGDIESFRAKLGVESFPDFHSFAIEKFHSRKRSAGDFVTVHVPIGSQSRGYDHRFARRIAASVILERGEAAAARQVRICRLSSSCSDASRVWFLPGKKGIGVVRPQNSC